MEAECRGREGGTGDASNDDDGLELGGHAFPVISRRSGEHE
jgi:hypothetical protein